MSAVQQYWRLRQVERVFSDTGRLNKNSSQQMDLFRKWKDGGILTMGGEMLETRVDMPSFLVDEQMSVMFC